LSPVASKPLDLSSSRSCGTVIFDADAAAVMVRAGEGARVRRRSVARGVLRGRRDVRGETTFRPFVDDVFCTKKVHRSVEKRRDQMLKLSGGSPRDSGTDGGKVRVG
jgi:hypothetical protein